MGKHISRPGTTQLGTAKKYFSKIPTSFLFNAKNKPKIAQIGPKLLKLEICSKIPGSAVI